MQAYNINYAKIAVLLFVIISFYWLMLPGQSGINDGPSSPTSKQHPHHDHHEINKQKQQAEKTEEEFKSSNLKEGKSKVSDESLKAAYEDKLAERDKTIKSLQQQLVKATDNDNESTKQLDEQIKKISSKSDELKAKYEELLRKYQILEKKQPEEIKDSKTKGLQSKNLTPFKGMKLVHLDLKGAPPKVAYLVEVITKAKEFGATGLLIEYEDMFPWYGNLSVLACKNAYSKSDLKKILNEAEKLNLEVIPLIQTFGHLEFVLKHKQFAEFRAVKDVTTSICPLCKDSVPFIKSMIDQIVNFHPKMKWIHLGGDEVWNIKGCDRCKDKDYSDIELYQRHMLPILKYTKAAKKDLSLIIWDDMMRKWSVKELKVMAQHVVPMVWGYVANLQTYRNFPADLWDKYITAFPNIFFASSFKGALKPWSNFVPIKQHLENHLSWLKIYRNFVEKGKQVTGIALTGRSRFDHYGPLCELLPAGIPSMALCLAVLDHGGFDEALHNKTSKMLGFEKPFQLDVNYFKNYKPEAGTFSGSKVYTLAGAFEQALGWRNWANVRLTGWTRPFNVKQGHLSFFQVNTTKGAIEESSKLLQTVKKDAGKVLGDFFYQNTVDEWIEDKITYSEQSMMKTLTEIKDMMKKNF